VSILDCIVLDDRPRGSTRELSASSSSGFGSSFSIYLTAHPTIGPQPAKHYNAGTVSCFAWLMKIIILLVCKA
jgi:hypothetical protein